MRMLITFMHRESLDITRGFIYDSQSCPTKHSLVYRHENLLLSTCESVMPRCFLLFLFMASVLVWCVADALSSLTPHNHALIHDSDIKPQQVIAWLGQYCGSCHGGSKPAGKRVLDRFINENALAENVLLLDQIWHQIEQGTMPPSEADQPTLQERKDILIWLKEQRDRQLRTVAIEPKRATLRRLNRLEYNNTIRDLLGIRFQPADDFPNDDIGYGFDNIGDVLSTSPLLLEKYLRAAETITTIALTAPKPPPSTKKRVIARDMQTEPRSRQLANRDRFRLIEQGSIIVKYTFPIDGEYFFRFNVGAHRAGDELPRMRLQLDGHTLKEYEITAEDPKTQRFEMKYPVKAGDHRLTLEFMNPYQEPTKRIPEENKNNDEANSKVKSSQVRKLVCEWIEIEGPVNAAAPHPPESYRRVFHVTPDNQRTPRQAALAIIKPLAKQAFRRPVTQAELDQLLDLFEASQKEGESFEAGVRFMVQRLLVSPHFLFHVERAKPDTRNNRGMSELDSYTMASRLSYFLWNSMPDEELFSLADQDRLRDPSILAQQFKRMLKDPKSQSFIEAFTGQWLQLRKLQAVSPDPKRFPNFTEELRQAMQLETELVFGELLRENRPIRELVIADFTYVNERLAAHYGLSGIKGPDMRRVSLKGSQRCGLLTHASILTVTSNPTRTSPVKRGKWIMENLLSAPPAPPPPGAGDLPEGEQAEALGTVRQRLEMHRSNPACASCHVQMDTYGFALENFDPIGRWRDKDGLHPIDATGKLPNGQSFRNLADFREVLLSKQDALRVTLVEKLLTFALGQGFEAQDRPLLLALAMLVKAKEDRLMDAIEVLIMSDVFRKTRGE